MASPVVRWGKRVIGYQEDSVPVVSVKDWVKGYSGEPKRKISAYLLSLFPIFGWIGRYNLTWLTGDVIAGLTVGMVVVPQSMSYAQLATLPPQYGLYSSFIGVLIYCFFATSKDVSIGPVAVMSLTVSQIIKEVERSHPNTWSRPDIATTLAFMCGSIVLGIGLLRIGWLVEFIPAPAVSGFITGSAINIIAGQVPGLMGITGFDTRAAPYHVIINTLKRLPRTKLDSAWGLTGLFSLYAIRIICIHLSKRYPRRARLIFFISAMRNAFVIIILTIAAWLYTRHRRSRSGQYPIKILQTVPRGLQHVGPLAVDRNLVKALGPHLPVATIILLLEHIAIAKSFGRLNSYKINPNQELIAIGVTNTIGSVFRAYPATGSFSRTALKAQSGVRTPAAGIITAIVVIVALYGLTPAFYWIPTAGLSAIIIHAVVPLFSTPSQVYGYWRISPLEFMIWAAAVLVTVFSTIENGIYTSIGASAVLLLIRLTHPREHFMGKILVQNGVQDTRSSSAREVFTPLKNNGLLDPNIRIIPPSPGLVIYRFEEGLLYPNATLSNSSLVDYVKANTRRGSGSDIKPNDRPWNDPGPGKGPGQTDDSTKPLLHAIVLDFTSVPQIDTTGLQCLIDTRSEVERWADHTVEFHFAGIQSLWIRRALIAGGFGTGTPPTETGPQLAAYSNRPGDEEEGQDVKQRNDFSLPVESDSNTPPLESDNDTSSLLSTDTPYFHIDLIAAVRAAESGIRRSN